MHARLLPLLFLAAPAAAQDAPPAAPAPTAVAPATGPSATDPTLVAFTSVDSRMTVPVSIAGAGPYRFLIDTGAQRTVISRELAATLGLATGHDVRLTAMTGTAAAGTVVIPSIGVTPSATGTAAAFGGGRIEAPALLRANLDADGMLGLDTLQDRSLSIDFDRRVMAVSPSVRRRRRELSTPGEIVVRARSVFGQLVVTDAWVGGAKVRLILDTGSAVSLGNSALRRRLGRRGYPPVPIEIVSVLGQSMTADYTRIDRVRLGGLVIDALPVAWADVTPFARFGLADRPAIMLGMDALALFRRVEIDFANRELRLLLPRALADQRAREGWPPG